VTQPQEMSARDHALVVAVLDVISKEAAAALKAARGDAESAFARARADGQTQQKVMLPDGTEIGLVAIKAGGKDIAVSEDAIEGWVRKHLPDGMESYIKPSALSNIEVLEVLRGVFPELVGSRIRPETRSALLKEIEQTGGYLIDKETGGKEKVAEVTDLDPTGAFSYRPAPGARDSVIAAWQDGKLRDVALGPLGIPAGDGQ
jgi:hypothetical protein